MPRHIEHATRRGRVHSATKNGLIGTTRHCGLCVPSATRRLVRLPNGSSCENSAAQIKQHTLSRLAEYLEQFEQQATRRGIQVHWAQTAEEHNQIVLDILRQHQVAGSSRANRC